ncbi:MAG: 4Fe-4S binding protein [Promethearchaeota archaeon]|nr:MAG: 4Fe-4S binding protein [Candidatus Lokiarchaeota archaeon]
MLDEKYKKAARAIVKAGVFPFPINDTMLKILKKLITEEELDLVLAFKRNPSQTIEQLKQNSKLSEEQIQKYAKSLAKKGIIFNQPSSAGIMVYRLMPILMVGIFEYTFMRKIKFTEEEKEIAKLFAQLFHEYSGFIQENYDMIVPAIFESVRPYDRTVSILDKNVSGEEILISINEELEVPEQQIIPTQEVEAIIKKFDDIAVGHCFCRHHQDLSEKPCKTTSLRENCFSFGKSARYTSEQGFARMISKDEALQILKKSEESGLVHKAIHTHSDITKIETSICNCCKCCCGVFEWWRIGMTALTNWTNFLSSIDSSLCIGCGTCVEKCPVDAIQLNDDNIVEVNPTYCIGCGVCAHFCSENAISLLEGMRKVYVPPPKLRS